MRKQTLSKGIFHKLSLFFVGINQRTQLPLKLLIRLVFKQFKVHKPRHTLDFSCKLRRGLMLPAFVFDLKSLNMIEHLQTMSDNIIPVLAPIKVIGIELLPVDLGYMDFALVGCLVG